MKNNLLQYNVIIKLFFFEYYGTKYKLNKVRKNDFDVTSYCCQIFLKSIIHTFSFPEHARSQAKGGP
jgi:hypothetical protein